MISMMMALAIALVTPDLGPTAWCLVFALLLLCEGTGRLICRLLKLSTDNDFLALMVGFVIIAHALMLADWVRPGAHPMSAALFVIPAFAGLVRDRSHRGGLSLDRAALIFFSAIFVSIWCVDIAPRLAHFRATGIFDFWIDAFVHSGHIARLTSPAAIGRGLTSMPDVPPPLYHLVSLMPAAAIARLTDLKPLDTTLLLWIPLGVSIMTAGIVALATALGGTRFSLLALAGFAALPAPEHWSFANGFLGFSWLLETSPGTLYSVGIGCAAFAALILGHRSATRAPFIIAGMLVAGCLLIRANTVVWLAPAAGLGSIMLWPGLRFSTRRTMMITLMVIALGILAAMSWPALSTAPGSFLFGYGADLFTLNGPTRVDEAALYLITHLGRNIAGAIGVGLIPVALLGLWFALMIVASWLCFRRGSLDSSDLLPWLLLLVCLLAAMMAPTSRHGDITEYRHRAGPLLVPVFAIWSIFLCFKAGGSLSHQQGTARNLAMTVVLAGIAFVLFAMSISDAKRPTMAWSRTFYGIQIDRQLFRLADALQSARHQHSTLVMAHQPSSAMHYDDASVITALTGIPAYIAHPAYFKSLGGTLADETARRRSVLSLLDNAGTRDQLNTIMKANGITHYLVSRPTDASFDPDRAQTSWHVGSYGIYEIRMEPK